MGPAPAGAGAVVAVVAGTVEAVVGGVVVTGAMGTVAAGSVSGGGGSVVLVVAALRRAVVDVVVDSGSTIGADELTAGLVVTELSTLERPYMNAPTATVMTSTPMHAVATARSIPLRVRPRPRESGGTCSIGPVCTTGCSPVGSSQLATAAGYPRPSAPNQGEYSPDAELVALRIAHDRVEVVPPAGIEPALSHF